MAQTIDTKVEKKRVRKVSPMARKAVEHYLHLSENLNQKSLNPAMKAARSQAQALFSEQAFPTQRDEAWQYTKLTDFVQTHFSMEGASHLREAEMRRFLPSFAVTKVVFVDGWFSELLSDDLSALPKGVSFETMRDAEDIEGGTQQVLNQQDRINQEPFGLLNSVLLADGYYLQVSANTSLESPIFVLYLQTRSGQVANVRNHIVVEENSEVTLVESYASLNMDATFQSFTNVVNELHIGRSARVKQVIVQAQNESSYYFNNQYIEQASKSNFSTFYAGLGSLTSRHQNHLWMDGEHIESTQNSACVARGRQTVDSRTDTAHQQVWGTSRQLHKYVLDDQAIGVFDGMIKVDQQAQKTDGQMDNKNLLLSNTAKMDCKPKLEIYADDVKCSHGSAAGQISQEQIFYLQARGIGRAQAIQMITQAFLMEPAQEISNPEIRRWVISTLSQKLNG